MSKPLYDLSTCDIFCTQVNSNNYQVDVWTKDRSFVGSTQLNKTDGDVFVPDNIVARYGYGRSIHRLLVDIATDLGGFLAIVRDGDARGGAIEVWSDFYADTLLDKINIEDYDNDMDWTSPDDDPQLFFAYRSVKQRFVDKEYINYFSEFNSLTHSLSKLGKDIFCRAYDDDCNRWIDTEYPLFNPVPIKE